MAGLRLTQRAHEAVSRVLAEGDLAVDATAGNGHDTLFLARQVGGAGHVWAFDVQQEAIDGTLQRLRNNTIADRVDVIRASHATMENHLPEDIRGRIAAIMFNLGYLPGSDRSCTTEADTTVLALDQAMTWLRRGGLVSVMVYRGHPGGRGEWEAVRQWIREQGVENQCLGAMEEEAETPVLLLIGR